MWIAPCVQSTLVFRLLKEEPNDEIGVGERGKGAKCGGDRPRRNAEKQGGAVSHPGFWVPGTVPTVTPNPLLSCLPDFLPVLLPNTGFSLPGQRIPSAAGPFPARRGRAKSLGITHPSPPSAPSLALLLGNAPPPPAPLAGAAPTAALYQFRAHGSPETLGPPRSVPISARKPNQG